jgi:MoaA/NifB/PqqE/SkfB family radical SAM enzyme
MRDRSVETRDLRFVWLEITGTCRLTCAHCYAESGPKGSDGTMSPADWYWPVSEHETITKGRGSHARTQANIIEA